jgi:hypothetical protein
MVTRTAYGDLPGIVRNQVEELIGPVNRVTAAAAGLNSAVAATLHAKAANGPSWPRSAPSSSARTFVWEVTVTQRQ